MQDIAAYAAIFTTYVTLNLAWVSLFAMEMYRRELSALLVDKPRAPMAGLFYLLHAAGVLILAVQPAVAAGDWHRATLSARVGSIGDNRLGGWYAYRASKAALNQVVRTAAIELSRRAPDALCVALHPGTVDTRLSAAFTRPGPGVHRPAQAAAHLLAVLDGLAAADTGGFFDWRGARVPW